MARLQVWGTFKITDRLKKHNVLEYCSKKRFHGHSCPYMFVLDDLPGELVSSNGTVIETFNSPADPGATTLNKVPVSKYLEAAGMSSLDAKISRSGRFVRDKGAVFLLKIKFEMDEEKLGYFGAFFTNPETETLPTRFTIRVERIAEAGFKVSTIVPRDFPNFRILLCTYYAIG